MAFLMLYLKHSPSYKLFFYLTLYIVTQFLKHSVHLTIKCIKHSLNLFTGSRTASVGQDLVFELFCLLRNVHNVNKQGGYKNNMVHCTTYHSLVISLSKKKPQKSHSSPEFLTFVVLPSKLGFDSILD